ncbi:MAG: hypothetical protein NPIRA03_41770 [Nitrospirales bacterium]|nr:MAG: hypothetical protein NPIRA03_41770 [Nitrospirales bacterium]
MTENWDNPNPLIERESFIQRGLLTNLWLLGAVLLALALQMATV